MKNKLITRCIFAMSVLFSSSSLAASFMPGGEPTSRPIGHDVFCRKDPSDCSSRDNNPQLLKLTNPVWDLLQDVNNSVNVMIQPATDIEMWGEPEVWSLPTNKGDCEDYVLLKQKLLIEQGVPASDLLITVVRQRSGEGHAVLAVRTDRGDFILDNLEPRIKSWQKTDYRFLKRQSELNAFNWVSIEDDRQVIVSSIKP